MFIILSILMVMSMALGLVATLAPSTESQQPTNVPIIITPPPQPPATATATPNAQSTPVLTPTP